MTLLDMMKELIPAQDGETSDDWTERCTIALHEAIVEGKTPRKTNSGKIVLSKIPMLRFRRQ